MAVELEFEKGHQTHRLRLEPTDELILSVVTGGFATLVNLARSGVQRDSPEDLLRRAIETFQFLTANWSVLPYRYGFECCVGGDPRLRTSGGGGASGFKINGRYCSIDGGVGTCYVR